MARSTGRVPGLTAVRYARFWGRLTGPNPTDRAKCGSKRHLICDGHGIPLAIKLTEANRHDSSQALPLLDGIPSPQGPRGLGDGAGLWNGQPGVSIRFPYPFACGPALMARRNAKN